MFKKNFPQKASPEKSPVNVELISTADLTTGKWELSKEKLLQLQKESPFESALYHAYHQNVETASKFLKLGMERLHDDVEKRFKENKEKENAELKKQLQEMRSVFEELTMPPFIRGTLLRVFETELKQIQEDSGELVSNPSGKKVQRAVISLGGARQEVNFLLEHPLPNLTEFISGQEVWVTAQRPAIIKVGRTISTGVTAEVVRRLEHNRLHVKGHNNDEFVVEMSTEMLAQAQLPESGDIIRVLPEAELAIEILDTTSRQLSMKESDLPQTQYEEIGGLDEQIQYIQESVELPFIYRAVYKRYDLKRPKGILLYGPPGCGKTMLAKAIARRLFDLTNTSLVSQRDALELFVEIGSSSNLQETLRLIKERREARSIPPLSLDSVELSSDMTVTQARARLQTFLEERGLPVDQASEHLKHINKRLAEGAGTFFMSIKGPELLSKWVGEAESSIRRIFATAREKATHETPVVLFFDEMESMFSRRGSSISSDIEKTIVPQLLAEIDGIEELRNVLIIGASNRYDLIDPAVLRPGRLDIKIEMKRPDKKAAREIFAKYLTTGLPFADILDQDITGKQQRVSQLIERAVQTIYSRRSEIVVYARVENDKQTNHRTLHVRKSLAEIVSGAMIANIIERAKRIAAKRETVHQAETGHGITWDDLSAGLEQECKEGKDQHIFEARTNSWNTAYIDTSQYEAEVILDKAVSGESEKLRWLKLKTRPWMSR